jgi:chorismate mutase
VGEHQQLVAIRGAVQVDANEREPILAATRELIECIGEANAGSLDHCIAIWLTATPDLTAAFPAEIIRTESLAPAASLLCAQEIPVEGAMASVIRVLMLTHCPTANHIYLGATAALIDKENTP